MMQKTWNMTETLVNEQSSQSTQRELPNEYQHDSVKTVSKNLWVLVLWTKVALKGLSSYLAPLTVYGNMWNEPETLFFWEEWGNWKHTLLFSDLAATVIDCWQNGGILWLSDASSCYKVSQ